MSIGAYEEHYRNLDQEEKDEPGSVDEENVAPQESALEQPVEDPKAVKSVLHRLESQDPPGVLGRLKPQGDVEPSSLDLREENPPSPNSANK